MWIGRGLHILRTLAELCVRGPRGSTSGEKVIEAFVVPVSVQLRGKFKVDYNMQTGMDRVGYDSLRPKAVAMPHS